MDIQRLRNLTTGRLHTDMRHIYEDLEVIIGDGGIMTHMIPRVMRAIEPWLRENVPDERFWDGKLDQTHEGEFELPAPTDEERSEMYKRYANYSDPLEGTKIIMVKSGND